MGMNCPLLLGNTKYVNSNFPHLHLHDYLNRRAIKSIFYHSPIKSFSHLAYFFKPKFTLRPRLSIVQISASSSNGTCSLEHHKDTRCPSLLRSKSALRIRDPASSLINLADFADSPTLRTISLFSLHPQPPCSLLASHRPS